MSATLAITVQDTATPRMAQLMAGLGNRTGLHEAVGREALGLTRNHLIHIAATRHATAERLGAAPTGHWAQAAEKTVETHDENAATITINQPGIGRVAHDVTITPKAGKKFLTIPLAAEAYGQRAYRMNNTFFLRSKAGQLFIARQNGGARGGSLVLLYLLVKSVFQKQDRSLLPSDDEYRIAAKLGVRNYVGYLLARGSQA